MRLRTAIARVTIGGRFQLSTGDGYLQSASVTLSEQERASSCSVSFYDPGLKLLNLMLSEFIDQGGVRVPVGLLAKPTTTDDSSTGTTAIVASGTAADYLKRLETQYGASDLTGLTDAGKKAYAALSIVNVRAFLDAIAVAELGDVAATNGLYGKLFGDTGTKETFEPRNLTDHPRQRRTSGSLTSSATGRYQFLDSTWDGLKKQLGLKDFKPISQEIGAVGLLMNRGILDAVTSGNLDQALVGAGKEWASIEGNPYGQGTATGKKTVFIANFNKFKQQYSTASTTPSTTTTTSTGTTVQTKPTTTATTTTATTTTGAAELPDTSFLDKLADSKKSTTNIDVTNGVRVFVEFGFNDSAVLTAFEFLLTDIRGSNDQPNTTKIGGKQVRAIISKGNAIFKVHRNISLRQLVINIAAKVGATAEVEDTVAANDIKTAIAQRESDYQMLLKLATSSGLFLRGTADKLKLEALKSSDKAIAISRKVLAVGSNWGDSASDDRLLKGDSLTSSTATSSSSSSISTVTGKGLVSFGGIFTPQVCAFMNLIAWKEVPDSMNPKSYYSNNFSGYFTDADIAAGGGFPASAGTKQNVGRYQFNREDWKEFGNGKYGAADQDGLCYKKLIYRNALAPLQAGNLPLAIQNAGKEWASLPGSPYGQVQAGYTLQDAIAYYNEQLKIFTGTIAATPSTAQPATTTTTKTTASSTGGTAQLPDTSFLDTLKDASTKVAGIQPLTTKADATQGIGKGFEGQLNVITIDMPSILETQPGNIAQLLEDSGFGGAIAREYRISEVNHNYSGSAITSSLNIYLPVTVKAKSGSGDSSTPSATTPTASSVSTPFTGDFAATPKSGDKIAGYTVSSPYGARSSPGGVGTTFHQGCDTVMPNGTPLYVFGKPGDKINVEQRNQGNTGGGLYAMFSSMGFTHMFMHCQKVFPGTYTIGADGMGIKIAESNNTGASTGSHFHYSQAVLGTFDYVVPQAGFIYAAITGRIPTSTTTK